MNERPEDSGAGVSKQRGPLWVILLFVGLLLAVGGVALAVSGGSDSSSDSEPSLGEQELDPEEFDVNADPSTGAGPPPLKIEFKTQVVNADGDVTYAWKFDEGGATATGSEQSFTYKKTGWKFAKVTARDEAGHKAVSVNAIRVWPKEIWTGLLSKKISAKQQQKILVDNLRAYERKTGAKIAGIGAAPLPGQKPLTPESRRAQRRKPALIRRANRRATLEYYRKLRAERRKKRQQEQQDQDK